MGRGKSGKKKQAPALTTTRKVLVMEPQIKTSSSVTDIAEKPSVSDTSSKKKLIKLVDVVPSSLLRISNGQPVSVVDGDVYASGVLVGRIPEQEGITTGAGKIHRVDPEKGEVWIKI